MVVISGEAIKAGSNLHAFASNGKEQPSVLAKHTTKNIVIPRRSAYLAISATGWDE